MPSLTTVRLLINWELAPRFRPGIPATVEVGQLVDIKEGPTSARGYLQVCYSTPLVCDADWAASVTSTAGLHNGSVSIDSPAELDDAPLAVAIGAGRV